MALPKGRLGEKVYKMFEEAGYGCEDIFNGRKLVFENKDAGIRYFWVKPSDVPIYVERGAADVGACGRASCSNTSLTCTNSRISAPVSAAWWWPRRRDSKMDPSIR